MRVSRPSETAVEYGSGLAANQKRLRILYDVIVDLTWSHKDKSDFNYNV